MNAILDFLQYLINVALQLMIWIVIAYAIMSWLVAFDVINLRNRTVYRISTLLDSIARPILAPFRRFIPPMGGLDLGPLVFIVLAVGVENYLLPPLFGWLHMLATPQPLVT